MAGGGGCQRGGLALRYSSVLSSCTNAGGRRSWGSRGEFWRPVLHILRGLNSDTRNPRNGPKKGAHFFGPFRGHVGMTCHETCHETYKMDRFKRWWPMWLLKRSANLDRFVAWHPHMPSKRSKKIDALFWTVSWISRFRI